MIEVKIPDIGDFQDVEIIDVLFNVGDRVELEEELLTLESDKATMPIPCPAAGVISKLHVSVGDRVSEGTLVLELESDTSENAEVSAKPKPEAPTKPEAETQPDSIPEPKPEPARTEATNKSIAPPSPERTERSDAIPHASPAVRRFARELGASLHRIRGTGPKGRILKEDIKAWTKQQLEESEKKSSAPGLGFAPMPAIDFSEFGETEKLFLSRIKKLSGPHLHRSWVSIPHVTHHDEADITDLEEFRRSLKDEAASQGLRITILSFAMKVLVNAMKKFPTFNASLAPNGEEIILKKYFNIGIAVDTPNGLVVPVIRDVDRKSIFDLAKDLAEVSERAREGKLKPQDLKGGCISISSLGGIGGCGFTPIINAPEVAIIGLSRSKMTPIWNGKEFEPRMMLPIDVSYDHRVIDGAEAARFSAQVVNSFSDVRRLAL
ncbi:MAG: dihydrolipoyllysine-residue acetyltransferase [Gammaproteobacteria bacterium]|nr:dihydrolipoyllysine-residue acetyltransferase [Gammaproteobacteria bacterium]MCY4219632.1 dihydrolipoyllysine-residue acetyltransferase [Gammaproteobacteria bacterium]MCY4275464.1 dihydrolipoyllysine-residue acetyltransferase [Gammaproteobacteria bacterium]